MLILSKKFIAFNFLWLTSLNSYIKSLLKNAEILNCSVPVYCLMPNHLHFLVYGKTEETSITEFVRRFKSYTSKMIKKNFEIFPLWQKRFYDHVIRKNESLINIAEYVYNNPVRAGLTENAEQYHWSGLFFKDDIFT